MGTEVDTSQVYNVDPTVWGSLWNETPQRDWTKSRELLENWSGIPSEEVLNHVLAVRQKAYSIFPWPCLATFAFLDLSISKHPLYQTVLSRVREKNQKLLDIGCCFGQDLRRLAADGAPTENLYGLDLHMEFTEYGYELFRDKDKMNATFLASDILAAPDSDAGKSLTQLEGKIDMIQPALFIHAFSWDDQVKVVSRLVALLNPSTPDAMIFGRQIGSIKPGSYFGEDRSNPNYGLFRHDVDTFKKLFHLVGKLTGTKWEVEATLQPIPHWVNHEKQDRRECRYLEFVARRL